MSILLTITALVIAVCVLVAVIYDGCLRGFLGWHEASLNYPLPLRPALRASALLTRARFDAGLYELRGEGIASNEDTAIASSDECAIPSLWAPYNAAVLNAP